jgi:hypothetical protein
MKSLLLITLFSAISVFAQGQPLEEIRKSHFERIGACDQTIYSNDQYLIVGLPKNSQGHYSVRVDSLMQDNSVYDVLASDRVVEARIRDNILYLLTQTTFEAWDLTKRNSIFSYKTHPRLPAQAKLKQRATGFILRGDWAVISHGVLGVAVMDMKSGFFVKLLPMITVSNARDIDLVDADTAILAIDNDAEGAFKGFYLMDLKTNEFMKTISLTNPYPTSVRVLDNNRLMSVFFNAIWKFDLKESLAAKEAKPNRITFRFPGLKAVELYGKVHFDDKYLYACFKKFNLDNDTFSFHTLTYDLDVLKLK